MATHKDLEVWKLGLDLVDRIYDLTETFPKAEIYGLANQMRRASVSIPSNIAEGAARNHRGELRQFVGVARGSLAELETQAVISLRRNFISAEQFSDIESTIESMSKMLYRFAESLK